MGDAISHRWVPLGNADSASRISVFTACSILSKASRCPAGHS